MGWVSISVVSIEHGYQTVRSSLLVRRKCFDVLLKSRHTRDSKSSEAHGGAELLGAQLSYRKTVVNLSATLSVFPVKTGIHFQQPSPSFPRRRESIYL